MPSRADHRLQRSGLCCMRPSQGVSRAPRRVHSPSKTSSKTSRRWPNWAKWVLCPLPSRSSTVRSYWASTGARSSSFSPSDRLHCADANRSPETERNLANIHGLKPTRRRVCPLGRARVGALHQPAVSSGRDLVHAASGIYRFCHRLRRRQLLPRENTAGRAWRLDVSPGLHSGTAFRGAVLSNLPAAR